MPLTLIKETGAGLVDANAYAANADGDAYHLAHLWGSSWTAATEANKSAALVMATRLIDQLYQFNGFKRTSTQALQWPRARCINPDTDNMFRTGAYFDPAAGNWFDETSVPKLITDSTCELARLLLVKDRTGDVDGIGIKKVEIYQGVSVEFDKGDNPKVVTDTIETALSKVGAFMGGNRGGMVKLRRG